MKKFHEIIDCTDLEEIAFGGHGHAFGELKAVVGGEFALGKSGEGE